MKDIRQLHKIKIVKKQKIVDIVDPSPSFNLIIIITLIMNQSKNIMLLALLLPAHFAMAQNLVGQPKEPITAAMYGDDTKSDIADLYHISE